MNVAEGSFRTFDDVVRIGAVADEVTEHERVIVAPRGRQHRFERLNVRVDVAEDQVNHQNPTHSSSRSTTSGTGCVPSMRDVRFRVGEPTTRVELLHLRAVGRQQAAVSGDPLEDACERNIEPGDRAIGKHQRAVVRLGERTAAGGHDKRRCGSRSLST